MEDGFQQQVSFDTHVHTNIEFTVSLFNLQQVRQLEEEKAHLQRRTEQADQMAEQADQRIREIVMENCDLHRQVQQLQEQVSSVVFHHTCTVCGVCRWLLLCPHTHSWQERSSPTGW